MMLETRCSDEVDDDRYAVMREGLMKRAKKDKGKLNCLKCEE